MNIALRLFGVDGQYRRTERATDRRAECWNPITYVPARNTFFLSFALAWVKVLGAADIFVGGESSRLQRLPGLSDRVHRGRSPSERLCHAASHRLTSRADPDPRMLWVECAVE